MQCHIRALSSNHLLFFCALQSVQFNRAIITALTSYVTDSKYMYVHLTKSNIQQSTLVISTQLHTPAIETGLLDSINITGGEAMN